MSDLNKNSKDEMSEDGNLFPLTKRQKLQLSEGEVQGHQSDESLVEEEEEEIVESEIDGDLGTDEEGDGEDAEEEDDDDSQSDSDDSSKNSETPSPKVSCLNRSIFFLNGT